jgi:predicted Rossmann-fold nucleotide-binding protein
MGTVTEISLVWNKLQTRVLDPRPIVLVGDCWRDVVDSWRRFLVVSDADVELLNFAQNAEDAANIYHREIQAGSHTARDHELSEM